MVTQKVLPNYVERDRLAHLPSETRIQSRISRNRDIAKGALVVELIHVIDGGIPCESVAHLQMGPQLRAVARRGSFNERPRLCIGAGGIGVHAKFLERISRTERPAVGHLPVPGKLDSMCLSEHQIFVHKRLDFMRRERSRFKEGGQWLRGLEIVVVGKVNGIAG